LDALLDEPPASVRALSLGDDIEFSVRFWHASDISSGNVAIDQVIRVIKPASENANVTFAGAFDVRVEGSGR
jgi:monoamine oxidase